MRGVAFLTTLLTARFLGVNEFAAFVVQQSVVIVMIPALEFGFTPLVTRVASAEKEESRFGGLSGEANRARAPIWTAALAVSSAVYLARPGEMSLLLLLGVLGATAQAAQNTLAGELVGRREFGLSAALRLTSPALAVTGTVVIVRSAGTAEAAAAVFAGCRVLPVVVIEAWLWARRARLPHVRSRHESLQLRRGLPFVASVLCMNIYMRSDVILLAAFGVSDSLVATYGLVYQFVNALQIIPASLSATVFPRIVTASVTAARRLIRIAATGSFAVACVSALLFFALAEPLMGLFGPEYAAAADEVRPLIFVLLPMSISQVVLEAAQARGLETAGFRALVAALIINLSLHCLLIPTLGVPGAITSTFVTETVVAVAVLGILRSKFKAPVPRAAR